MLNEIINGALISGSLIIAIGAQNIFVLKQGLLKNHIFWVCLICFLCDFGLMSIGVFGVGTFISQNTLMTNCLAILGALFLLWYGVSAFKSAYDSRHQMEFDSNKNRLQLRSVILATLAVTLLNPHVYLDTVVIVGGIAGTLTDEQKVAFLIGAVIVSMLWFFAIGYGARLLAPLFKKKNMWTVLDCIVGCVMFYIASLLVIYVVNS